MKKPFSYYVPFQQLGAPRGSGTAGKSLHTMSDRNLRETEPTPVAVNPTPPGPGGPARQGHEGRRRLQGGGFKGGKGTAQPSTRPNHDPNIPDPTDPPTNPDDPRAYMLSRRDARSDVAAGREGAFVPPDGASARRPRIDGRAGR